MTLLKTMERESRILPPGISVYSDPEWGQIEIIPPTCFGQRVQINMLTERGTVRGPLFEWAVYYPEQLFLVMKTRTGQLK